jgi:Fic family protein
MHKIVVSASRDNPKDDPMQVVSGHMGRQVHYQAPDSNLVPDEIAAFLEWFNQEQKIDAVIKAAIAHLWFVTIHPSMTAMVVLPAIADMQLARSDDSSQRFYSMSAQIRTERNAYYGILEKTQKDDLDITAWLEWFLGCLHQALLATDETLAVVLKQARFWERHVAQSFNDRQKLMLNKLLDGFTGKLTSSKWAAIAKCSSDTALRDINDLLKKGILTREESGGRSTGDQLAR